MDNNINYVKKITYKMALKAFLGTYPNGYMYPIEKGKADVCFKKDGKYYTYRVCNYLDLLNRTKVKHNFRYDRQEYYDFLDEPRQKLFPDELFQ